MKKLFILIAGLCFIISSSLSAQDTIKLVNGTKIPSKVIEVTSKTVKYKDFSNLEGPDYILENSEIASITFQNGSSKIFDNEGNDGVVFVNDVPVKQGEQAEKDFEIQESDVNNQLARISNFDYAVKPGQKYRENKRYYSYKKYMPQTGDLNPFWMGFASYWVPGLGQMICGEVGRGFAWLGSSYGAYFIGGVGWGMLLANAGSSFYPSDYGYSSYNDPDVATVGTLLMLAGFGAGITLNVLSIVDAVKVAKVTNMYRQDLRENYVSFNVKPFIGAPNAFSPVKDIPLGMTLSVNF